MLEPGKKKIIEELVATSSKEELIWINGYLAGLLSNHFQSTETAIATAVSKPAIGKIYSYLFSPFRAEANSLLPLGPGLTLFSLQGRG